MFDRDYQNPRIYAVNVAYEQELREHLAGYVDFIWTKGTKLTRFLHGNRGAATCCNVSPGTGNSMAYAAGPFAPQLDEVMVTTSRGKSLYRGMTLGLRKRFANGHQFEVNYVLAKDEDDDSNERDPFVDYSFNVHDLSLDYGPSARDVRHKFNVRLLRNSRVRTEHARAGAFGAADYAKPAGLERNRSGPQLDPQGQQASRSTGAWATPSRSAAADIS